MLRTALIAITALVVSLLLPGVTAAQTPPDPCLLIFEAEEATYRRHGRQRPHLGHRGPRRHPRRRGKRLCRGPRRRRPDLRREGNDWLDAGPGNDFVIGDTAESILLGFPAGMNVPGGRDHILGGGGDDQLFGEGGADQMSAGAGDDFATGQMDKDRVDGDAGNDGLFGGPADDLVRGGEGSDDLVGNFGSDVLLGGEGDDRLLGDNPPPPVPLPNPHPRCPRTTCATANRALTSLSRGRCEQENQIELIGPFPEG